MKPSSDHLVRPVHDGSILGTKGQRTETPRGHAVPSRCPFAKICLAGEPSHHTIEHLQLTNVPSLGRIFHAQVGSLSQSRRSLTGRTSTTGARDEYDREWVCSSGIRPDLVGPPAVSSAQSAILLKSLRTARHSYRSTPYSRPSQTRLRPVVQNVNGRRLLTSLYESKTVSCDVFNESDSNGRRVL